jgi:hypothetical protein
VESFDTVSKSVVPTLSIPSTLPDWSSTSRWAASALHLTTTVGARTGVPVQLGLAASVMWSPFTHSLSMYGPVPFGCWTIDASGTCAAR